MRNCLSQHRIVCGRQEERVAAEIVKLAESRRILKRSEHPARSLLTAVWTSALRACVVCVF